MLSRKRMLPRDGTKTASVVRMRLARTPYKIIANQLGSSEEACRVLFWQWRRKQVRPAAEVVP